MAPNRRSQPSSSIAKVTPLETPLPSSTPAVPGNPRKLKALLSQGRSRVHRFVKFRIVETDWFAWLIVAVIVVNAVSLGVETMEAAKDWMYQMEMVDYVCLAFYALEFLLKFYSDPIGYWLVAFNIFDFAILVTSLFQIFLSNLATARTGFQILRVLRVIRVARIMRTVRYVKGLEVLIVALWVTLRQWLICTLVLLLLLMYFVSIVAHNFFGHEDVDNWGTLRNCFLSMASYVTTDGWFDAQSSLEKLGYINSSRFFAIAVIWSMSFMLTNLFVAVILMNIDDATAKYEEEEAEHRAKIVRHKKELMMMQQRDALKQLIQFQKKGKYLNFQQMVAEFESTLKHEDIVVQSDLCTNIVWLETYILTMENMTHTIHNVQQFHFEMANILTKALELNLHSKYGIAPTNF